jgi:hypothetical protein
MSRMPRTAIPRSVSIAVIRLFAEWFIRRAN